MAHKQSRHKKLAAKRHRSKVASLRGARGEIRPYGPGKFDTHLDGYVHSLSLDGFGESLGDVESFGHYESVDLGRSLLKEIEKLAKEDKDTLTTAEKNMVRGHAGAILFENSQGFVDVTYYKKKRALDKAWSKLEKEYEEFESEGDDSDHGREDF